MEIQVGGEVLEMNVVAVTSEQIKGMEYKEFCRTAVHLMRIQDATDGVEQSVAAYIHSRALECVERNGGFPILLENKAAVKRDFIGTLSAYEAYLTSEEAGKCRVLTMPKPIDSAKRKIIGGMDRCADFRTEDTCSKIAAATSKFNKAKKQKEEDDLLAEYQAAQKPASNDGGGEPSAIEIRLAAMAKQYEEIAAINPERADDMLAGQQEKVERALRELKAGVAERMSA